MTHVSPQTKQDGEIQLKLIDAWGSLNEALQLAADPVFGHTTLRREWSARVEALRGCILLAAARLIDVAHLEAVPAHKGRKTHFSVHEFARRRASTPGESSVVAMADEVGSAIKEFALMCPHGFPSMEFGLGRLAAWIAAGEMRLTTFFGVASTPGKRRAAKRTKKLDQRQKVLDALAQHDAVLEKAGWSERSLASKAREMRIRAGVEEAK